jgi:hypothetical protein
MVGTSGVSICMSLESGGRFYVGAFGRNMVSVSVMFPPLICFVKTFYKF